MLWVFLYSSECDSKLGVIPINTLNNCTSNISYLQSSIDSILQNVNQIGYGFSEQEKRVVSQPENVYQLSNSGKLYDLVLFY